MIGQQFSLLHVSSLYQFSSLRNHLMATIFSYFENSMSLSFVRDTPSIAQKKIQQMSWLF